MAMLHKERVTGNTIVIYRSTKRIMYTEWISMAARKPVHPNDPSGFTQKKASINGVVHLYNWIRSKTGEKIAYIILYLGHQEL